MMLLRARDNNIQSFAYIWLYKGNQHEFLKHPKIFCNLLHILRGTVNVGDIGLKIAQMALMLLVVNEN